ncbi:PREDICTED: uncharacterized protein LOC104602661 [Nelumbo nucifera]|uniref:Uncharacterized protein LOC104602661 n=1 Tax=Nelumbo nucifera TaxID=4432 RepID=A0A1U8APE0_NELNU|nr:PREDICTED: uncharacterized protein LOC104602661 [Nelumbo nucifera]
MCVAMADNHQLSNLVGAMDRLWFHYIILLPEPMSLKPQPTMTRPITEIPLKSVSVSTPPSTPPSEEEISSISCPVPLQGESSNNDSETNVYTKEKPTRLNFLDISKPRSHSSSPSTKKRRKHQRYTGGDPSRRIQKTMSCKSLWELEYEEVKGFMDLGFRFDKMYLSPRMMSVIPGLQRLGQYQDDDDDDAEEQEDRCDMKTGKEEDKDEEVEEEKQEERVVIRPYLSEAWLIKRPDSPLLNLRIPRASATADMKKHLRSWARTIAYVIQQES